MLIGERRASAAIQIVAVVLGIPCGAVASFVLADVLPIALAPGVLIVVFWLWFAFSAYFLSAPATWRGLWRRCLLVFAASFLSFAGLGYLSAFAGIPGGQMPALPGPLQIVVVAAGVITGIGYLALRGRRRAAGAPGTGVSVGPEPPASPAA